ncbi:MAG: sigma-54 dependent transcriptional regulator [Candidatus Krumholzibacteria bacterium]|nr:sigma-54 dependent transcriptional regulator [Candidatus Krumholzibacteria bacterium]
MRAELWSLIQGGEIESMLREAAAAGETTLAAFQNISDVITRQEPPAGAVLVIDGTGKFKNYLTIIKRIQKNFFGVDVVALGPPKTSEAVDRERAAGVDIYVPVPPKRDELQLVLAEALAIRGVKSEAKLVGRSREIREMLEIVLRVAPTDAPVLIEGESGSGKEVTARAIHLMSKRREKAFEAVNCGSLAEGVLESELFGHERGSFTGAVARRQGLFERANRGTLFLDEVGEMSLNMQVRLLRVIETGELLRVGGSERIHTDARIIAATNRALEVAIERGQFRKDLYYRLKVVQIRIPPLRARSDDIPLLAHYFVAQSARKHGKKIRGIEKEAMDLLLNYPWPGNVRELANVIDNLTILSADATIRASEVEKRLKEKASNQVFPDLPVHVPKGRDDVEREIILNSLLSLNNDLKEVLRILKGEEVPPGGKWKGWVEVKQADEAETRSLEKVEREAIRDALAANGGNRRKAAKQLGLSERTLYRRIKEYKLS